MTHGTAGVRLVDQTSTGMHALLTSAPQHCRHCEGMPSSREGGTTPDGTCHALASQAASPRRRHLSQARSPPHRWLLTHSHTHTRGRLDARTHARAQDWPYTCSHGASIKCARTATYTQTHTRACPQALHQPWRHHSHMCISKMYALFSPIAVARVTSLLV